MIPWRSIMAKKTPLKPPYNPTFVISGSFSAASARTPSRSSSRLSCSSTMLSMTVTTVSLRRKKASPTTIHPPPTTQLSTRTTRSRSSRPSRTLTPMPSKWPRRWSSRRRPSSSSKTNCSSARRTSTISPPPTSRNFKSWENKSRWSRTPPTRTLSNFSRSPTSIRLRSLTPRCGTWWTTRSSWFATSTRSTPRPW